MDQIINPFVCAFLRLKGMPLNIIVHSYLSPWYLGTVFAALQTMKHKKKNPSLPVKRWKCFTNVYEKSIDEGTGPLANLMVARTRVLLEILWTVVVIEAPPWTNIL